MQIKYHINVISDGTIASPVGGGEKSYTNDSWVHELVLLFANIGGAKYICVICCRLQI